MKRVLIIVGLLFMFTQLKSQINGFHIGGRLGLGESTIESQGLSNVQPKLAISGGVASNYQFNKFLGINADFLLSSIGAGTTGGVKEKNLFGTETYYPYVERYNLIYAELPVTGQLSIWFGNFFIRGYAGPGINFNLLSTQTRQYDDADYNSKNGYIAKRMDQVNNISYSMIYGFGVGAAAKDNKLFFLDLRFNKGMSSLGRINNYEAFNNYYCITAGYVF